MSGLAAGAAFAVAAAAVAVSVGEGGKSVDVVIDMVPDHSHTHPVPVARHVLVPVSAPNAESAGAGDTGRTGFSNSGVEERPERTASPPPSVWEWMMNISEQMIDSDYRVVMHWIKNLAPLLVLATIIALLEHIVEVTAVGWLAYGIMHGNNVVRTERALHELGHVRPLLMAIGTYTLHIAAVIYIFPSAFFGLGFFFGPLAPKGLMEAIWFALLSDLVLLEFTIGLKALATIILRFMPSFNHARLLLGTIEVFMQFVRTIMPTRVWLSLLASRGVFAMPMLAILLPAAYSIYKLVSCGFVIKAFVGMLSSAAQVTVGRRATEEDLVGHDRVCAICQDEHKRPVILTCRHTFCEDCISEWVQRQHFCPMCRVPVIQRHAGILWGDGATQTAPLVL